MHPIITAKLDDLKALCTKHRVATLEVFGSILRDDFGPDSDVDVLVTFEPGTDVCLRTYMDMEEELQRIFGRDVDLIERSVIEQSENFIRRRAILSNTETVYRAA